MGDGDEFLIRAHCWRRGPDGSIAVYEIEQRRRWQRVYEHEGSDAVTDEQAHNVALSILQQLLTDLYPRLLHAIRSAQGIDPDLGRRKEHPDA